MSQVRLSVCKSEVSSCLMWEKSASSSSACASDEDVRSVSDVADGKEEEEFEEEFDELLLVLLLFLILLLFSVSILTALCREMGPFSAQSISSSSLSQ